MKLILHRYLFKLSRLLRCKRKKKKEILAIVGHSLKLYMEENVCCNWRELNENLGTPADIARCYGFLKEQ